MIIYPQRIDAYMIFLLGGWFVLAGAAGCWEHIPYFPIDIIWVADKITGETE